MGHSRGDTLVEVLMSIVVLSLVIVGSITIMTRGLAAAQLSVEHSQVRMSVNTQIEMLRLVRDQYVTNPTSLNAATWNAVASATDSTAFSYTDNCTPSKATTAFYLRQTPTRVERVAYTSTAANVIAEPGRGLWIEAVRSEASVSPRYIDFIIRACWVGSGAAGQQRTVTGVRLYDPRP